MEKLVPFNPSLVPRRRVPPLQSHREIMSEENTIDPDDGNSWICSACTLPIFSTPFKISYQKSKENAKLLLHDQCASLPEKLMDHPLHPRQALHLVKNDDSSASTISCKKCREKCGTMFYKCIDSFCGLQLDLLCSLPMIKILHRSHEHRLMVIRGSASFICGACGTQHQGLSAPSYFCSACNFWIHRDCASLPNAIKLLRPKHQHSLFLTYDRSTSSSAFSSSSSSSKCAVCGDVLQSLGAYLCVKCGYYVHIRCATSDPQCFQPVLIRDAKLADLLHLPMADERANLVQYMLENTSAAGDDDEGGGGGGGDDDGCRHDPKLQKHSLIFQYEDAHVSDDDDDDGTGHSSRVCTEVEVEAEVKVEEEGGGGGGGGGDDDGCKHDPKLYKHSLIYHDEDKDVSDDDDDDDDDDGIGHSSRVCTEVEVEAEVEFEEEEGGGDDDDGCKHDPKLYKHSLIYHDEDKDDEDEERGGGGGGDDDDDGCRHDPELKKHSLILHDEDEDVSDDDDDDDDDGKGYSSRVCNACVEFISPPFYNCSKCRDFLLHSCCAHLPRKIQHPIHPEHTLFLFSETPVSRLERPGFTCTGCLCLCSGFGYSCETCSFIKLDVVCALMPPSITHESHGKTHILHMSRNFYSVYKCSCCMLELNRIFYECSNCLQLKLHGRCALLPTTLTHKFDRHPLKLTTSPFKISVINSTTDDAEHSEAEMQHICDVCEMNIDKKEWYYSCKQWDNSFHINCIPFLNRLSRLKFGVSVDVNFHDCPLTLVPQATLSGYHCDLCREKFKYIYPIGFWMDCAYECTKCNYRVHGECATQSSVNMQ